MSNQIKADLRTWVEAAIAERLANSTPASELPAFMVGRALAQLLWFWRFDVPSRWRSHMAHLDYVGMALRLKDYSSLTSVNDLLPRVSAALEDGRWEAISALPEEVWHWINHITGLTKDEWEALPGIVEKQMSRPFTCPRCEATTSYQEMGNLTEVSDPFSQQSRAGLHLRCPKCESVLAVDAFHSPRIRAKLNKMLVPYIAGAAVIIALIAKLYQLVIRWLYG